MYMYGNYDLYAIPILCRFLFTPSLIFTGFLIGELERANIVVRFSISLSVTKCCTSRNVNKTRTILNFDPVGGRHGGIISLKTTHASSEVVGRHLDVSVLEL